MGTARLAREADEAAAQKRRSQEIERLQKTLAQQERTFEAETAVLLASHAAARDEIERAVQHLKDHETTRNLGRVALAQSRSADQSEV